MSKPFLSVLIPYRRDCWQRERNKSLVEMWLYKNMPKAEIIVREYPDGVFRRAKYLNELMDEATGLFVAFWDVDCIVDPSEVDRGCSWLWENEERNLFYWPYRKFFNVYEWMVKELTAENALEKCEAFKSQMNEMAPVVEPRGGVVLVNKEIYKNIRDNERFVNWSKDDWYRYEVGKKLGYEMARSQNNLYHFDHERPQTDAYTGIGDEVYSEMMRLTKEELETRIKNGWHKGGVK